MTTYKHTLYEGVLNDDYITVNSDNTATLTTYTFATEWSNTEHKAEFPDIEKAIKSYRREFPDRVFEQGKRWIEEDSDGDDYNINDTPEEYWTMMVYEQVVEN